MYCSTCGVAVPDSLSYCNHCGARLSTSNSDKVAPREVRPELLVSAMAGTFILGIPVITVLLGVLKTALGLELGQILAFAVLCFLMLLSLEGVFVLLLFRRNREAKEPAAKELTGKHATKELAEPQVQALREPLTSVTDHTTRAFEPLYPNQKKTT